MAGQPPSLPLLIAERPEVHTPVAVRLAVGPHRWSARVRCTDGWAVRSAGPL